MLRVDFHPGTASPGGPPLWFGEPERTVVATRVSEVVPVLDTVDRACADGRWAVGFVAYGAAPAFDPAFRVPGRDEGTDALPLAWFALFDGPVPSPACGGPSDPTVPGGWRPETSATAYGRAVDEVHAAIRRGDTYQTNLTTRLHAPWDAGDADLARYERLLAAQGRAFGVYLDLGRHHVLSVSPELFFARAGDRVTTRPMKGTARRGRSSAEDANRLADLQASEKDRAENVMITDLLRNDLSRVARRGTLAVPQLLAAEAYPTVWQLTSTVTADVDPGRGLAEVFGGLFPCGSVTGAPKIATMRLIAELETSARGLYCGAIGVVAPGGDATFAVAIRTVVADTVERSATYGVGSGVTIDSTARAEHDELLAKAAVLTRVVPDFDLLETLRLEDGRWWLGEDHLARLAASAAYFGRPDPVPAARRALEAVRTDHPVGRWRVRLVVSADRAHTEVTPLPATPDAPLSLVLAAEPVAEEEVFLAHKTTWREPYAVHARRAQGTAADDTLLWNTRGEVTETTIGNVVVRDGADWWTPPVGCGLLPGVERALALDQGRVRERVVTVGQLRAILARGGELWFLNSVRGWRRATLLR